MSLTNYDKHISEAGVDMIQCENDQYNVEFSDIFLEYIGGLMLPFLLHLLLRVLNKMIVRDQ